MPRSAMRSFWDRRAREDPYYFVDNRLRYRKPDTARFWMEGERDLDTLLETLGVAIQPGDAVVEIGCGLGRLTRAIAARAERVEALDVSQAMLDRARSENPSLSNVNWILGDGTSLEGVADASADACVSHVVFQHIPDPKVTLGYVREMGRVLRPGGWSAFQVSNDPDVHRRPSLGEWTAQSFRAAVGRAPRGQAAAAWRGSAVELGDVRAAAREGGMHIERVAGEGTQFCLVLAVRPRRAGR